MALSYEESALVAMIVQSVTYGFFAFLFVQTTLVIMRQYRKVPEKRQINRTLLLVSTIMFTLSTAYLGINTEIAIAAFIGVGSKAGANSSAITDRLISINNADYRASMAIYAIQTYLGDGFMIYRVYMVWGRNPFVCIPVVATFLGSFGVGADVMRTAAAASDDTTAGHSSFTARIIAFFWLTVFTNGCSTALIATRIWWMNRQINSLITTVGSGRINFRPAVTIIVESGAIYSICMVMLIILYESGSAAQVIIQDAMPQIMGIIFTLIIMRVSLGTTTGMSSQEPNTQQTALTDMFRHMESDTANSGTFPSAIGEAEIKSIPGAGWEEGIVIHPIRA